MLAYRHNYILVGLHCVVTRCVYVTWLIISSLPSPLSLLLSQKNMVGGIVLKRMYTEGPEGLSRGRLTQVDLEG